MLRSNPGIIVAVTVSVGLIGAAMATPNTIALEQSGKAISSDVRMIGGKAYVPVEDIAVAFNLKVSSSISKMELSSGPVKRQLTSRPILIAQQ